MRNSKLKIFLRNKLAIVGAAGIFLILFTALAAPWLAPYDPLAQDPYQTLAAPMTKNFLGTDYHGRDVLSRVIHGAKISLLVSVTAIGLGLVVGTLFGVSAGYLGGLVESLIMRTVDILMCFPTLVLGVAVMTMLGSGVNKVIWCIAIVMAPRFARLAYGSTLSIKKKEYIEAAQAISAPLYRVIILHILPNIFGEILVVAVLWLGTAIQIEASLSFIGIGVPPPNPTWGNMIRAGMEYLPIASWISIFPGIAIFITIISFNMFGDGIRDIADPKLYR
jgi:peptide/nickel transport system permease protein